MKLDTRTADDVAIIDLEGRLVSGVGDVMLREAVNRLLADGTRKILLDLTEISHIDSSGVGELVASRRICQRFGGACKFVRASDAVSRVLDIAKILPLFSFYEDVDDALTSFQRMEVSDDGVFEQEA